MQAVLCKSTRHVLNTAKRDGDLLVVMGVQAELRSSRIGEDRRGLRGLKGSPTCCGGSTDPGTWRHRTAQNATEIPQYDEVRAIAAGSTVYEEGCSCIGIVLYFHKMRSVVYNLYIGVCTVQSSQHYLYLNHVISLKRTVIEASSWSSNWQF